ncbi:MAG: DUF6406 domain-containing protein, partial [Myxococcota bacterium]
NQGASTAATESPMPDQTSSMNNNTDTAPAPSVSPASQPDPTDAIRLRQGTNTRIGDYELGVMLVGEGTRAGDTLAPEIKLSVFHRPSDKDEDRVLRIGDALELGEQTFKLLRIELARGDEPAYGVIAPSAR